MKDFTERVAPLEKVISDAQDKLVQDDLAKKAAESAIQEAEAIVAANNLKVTDNEAYLALTAEQQQAMDEALAAA